MTDTKDRYKDTVFLPQTEFPMRAGLAQKEPELLAYWQKIGLYKKLREQGKNRPKFTLHDGPPYANGNIHIGHATNKILKDVVIKSQTMLGKDCPYVPGWDCHGLPIEWKVEESYRDQGKDKDEVDTLKFREECRDFAQKWVDIQREEFKRLGIQGDWENPYLTMRHKSEADIAGEIHRFLLNGGLYKGVRPVMWSVVEKTALADAEVEYMDHKSPTIWVKFPVKSSPVKELEGASIVIWTTTPWTIPGNRAVAFGPEFEYGVYDTGTEKIVLATALAESVREAAKIESLKLVTKIKGEKIAGTICRHPWHGQGYDFDVPALAAEFVTTDAGTGFVHIAPGHGEDDFYLGKEHGIEVPQTVGDDGVFYDHVPLLAGKRVFTPEGKDGDANGTAIKALIEAGALLAKGSVRHSYPHSWRSKAPLIFRTTSQWFISMDKNGLREKSLKAIDETSWWPPRSKNRIEAMVSDRPDWCISRQRAWGVPIAMFVEKASGEPLRDPAVCERIVKIFEQEGSDAWYARPAQDFLGNQYKIEDYEQVMDIVDVWFESGSTHAFVMNGEQSDLYLEGSDQHRGWFQSSLLESVGTRGRAPFRNVLTHGFVLDEQGRKMSKSEGNVVAPQEVCDQYGADILRLWVVNTDYTDDVRIGSEIIKHQADIYRRFRNTLRYLLGSLAGFTEAERVPEKDFAKMPELERWILHRVWEMDRTVKTAIENYHFQHLFSVLHHFCAVDLSAVYFDIRKDSLYCDHPDDFKRRSARTVMDILFDHLTAWLAPVLCFTAEEAWLARGKKGAEESVHLRTFPAAPASWEAPALIDKWMQIKNARSVVTAALEKERAEKRIGSSLQAAPTVYLEDKNLFDILKTVDFAEICITSDITLKQGASPAGAFISEQIRGIGVVSGAAEGEKCARCWRVLPDVGKNKAHPAACTRCAEAVERLAKAA